MANFSPGRPMPVFLDRQDRLECPAAPAPGCRSALEPGRVGLNAATTGTAGRRRLRVPMPATWASATAFSPDRPAKRPVGARRILPSSQAGPNPLGKNQSLSSPPLEPRRLLLSAMRQKVSKDRSQEGCAPLANPRRNCPNLAKPSCGPTPAAFAEKTPAFECRAAPENWSLLRQLPPCG
jgi:hypothetical protein